MPVDRKVQGKCSVIKLLAGGSDKQRCNSSDHQGLSASTPLRNKRQTQKAAAFLVSSFFEHLRDAFKKRKVVNITQGDGLFVIPSLSKVSYIEGGDGWISDSSFHQKLAF